jgi:hypothetical protein
MVQIFIYILICDLWLKFRNISKMDEDEKAYNSWYGKRGNEK